MPKFSAEEWMSESAQDVRIAIRDGVYGALAEHVPDSNFIEDAIREGVKEAFAEYLEKHGLA
jgi:hypothetical protein